METVKCTNFVNTKTLLLAHALNKKLFFETRVILFSFRYTISPACKVIWKSMKMRLQTISILLKHRSKPFYSWFAMTSKKLKITIIIMISLQLVGTLILNVFPKIIWQYTSKYQIYRNPKLRTFIKAYTSILAF